MCWCEHCHFKILQIALARIYSSMSGTQQFWQTHGYGFPPNRILHEGLFNVRLIKRAVKACLIYII